MQPEAKNAEWARITSGMLEALSEVENRSIRQKEQPPASNTQRRPGRGNRKGSRPVLSFDYPKDVTRPIPFPFAFMTDARKRQEYVMEIALALCLEDTPHGIDKAALLQFAAMSESLFEDYQRRQMDLLIHEVNKKIDSMLKFHQIPVQEDGSHWLHLLYLVAMSELSGFKICPSDGRQNTNRFRDVKNAILVEWTRLGSPNYKNAKIPTIAEAIHVARSRMTMNRPISDRALNQSYQRGRNVRMIQHARELEKISRADAIKFLSMFVEDHQ